MSKLIVVKEGEVIYNITDLDENLTQDDLISLYVENLSELEADVMLDQPFEGWDVRNVEWIDVDDFEVTNMTFSEYMDEIREFVKEAVG